jgi:signal transduction histidine kinase
VKTSIKILSLIVVMLCLLGISLYFMFSTEKTQQKDLVKLTTNQYSQAFETLLENASTRYSQQVSDYTYWDEMCSFVKSKNVAWSDENLATMITSYDIDNIFVISPDNQTVVYAYPNDEIQIPDLIQDAKGLLRDLYRKRLLETYILDKESGRIGILYAATIHPTNDVQRLTKPQGYFFICKYWDNKFIDEIERISGTNITVESSRKPIVQNDETITFYKELKAHSGKVLAYLKIERPAPYLKLNRDFSGNVLFIFTTSAILLILIVFVALFYLIGKPLTLLGNILRGNKALLPKLKKFGGEYVQIGEIIERSITTQEELEKAKIRAEESDRMKSAFLANISHEIRTPMNAIVGFSQILPDQFDNKAQLKECTDIISQRSQDLLDIVNSMIDMSRINTGSLMVQTKSCDLNQLFDDLNNQFGKIRTRLGKEAIEFTIHSIDNRNLTIIVTDFNKLKEIFVHLLSNAFKFTEKGKIEVGCFEDSEKGIVFFVSDTGKGIPAKMQTKIFNHFTRLNNELTDNQTGTGLGLAIVKGLIDLLEGTIWLESETGKGSTFYFTVPNSQTPSVLPGGMYL